MLSWFRHGIGNCSSCPALFYVPIENSLFDYGKWDHVMMDGFGMHMMQGFGMGGGGIGMFLLLVIAVLLIAVLIKILAK